MESPETGWTVLELLTLDRRIPAIPVIVCSEAMRGLQAHEGLLKRYGIGVFPKPFDIDALYTRVEEALNARKMSG